MKYSPILDCVNTDTLRDMQAACPQLVVEGAETAYHQKISDVCDVVIAGHKHILLVTGPSASGKTTSAQKLGAELRARGKKVSSISLDNFYKDSSELPKWTDGYQNYESVEGLDIPHFEKTVGQLLHTGHASLPLFNFITNKRDARRLDMDFDEQTYLIFEGIHALNPEISGTVEQFPTAKIYISVHSEFVDTNGDTLLTARDLRLMRRILRDFTYRGSGAEETLRMWEYVLRGEDLYIRPYRRYADLHIDSTHAYEPFLYHEDLLAALCQTDPASPYHETVERLRAAAMRFFAMPKTLVPASSLIQEFIKP